MSLQTVGEVITQVRILVQDTDAAGYRYSEASIYQALNEGLLETKRMRPDFFRGLTSTPQYSTIDSASVIDYPDAYVPALVDYTCGRVQLRDDEATTDQRAGVFITSFRRLLGAPG